MIKALIFDFDGLILDTETPIFEAWKQVYEEHGCRLSIEEYAGCIGSDHNGFDPYKDLEEKSGVRPDWDEVRPRLAKTYRERIDRSDARPGIRRLVGEAQDAGLRLAVASSSHRDWVAGHLERLDLFDAFELFRTRDDVEDLKPAPDLFLEALRALGLASAEALVLEDSPNGILAARRAGIFCVAVPNPTTETLPLNDPDLLVSRLDEVSLDFLLASANHRNPRV